MTAWRVQILKEKPPCSNDYCIRPKSGKSKTASDWAESQLPNLQCTFGSLPPSKENCLPGCSALSRLVHQRCPPVNERMFSAFLHFPNAAKMRYHLIPKMCFDTFLEVFVARDVSASVYGHMHMSICPGGGHMRFGKRKKWTYAVGAYGLLSGSHTFAPNYNRFCSQTYQKW